MASAYPGYNGPINENPGDGEAPIVIYGYIPSRALGCVGAIIFALAFVTHFALFLRLRGTRVFQALLALGCVMEVVGYCMRIMSHFHPYKVVYYVVQYFLIVVAPVFFSAAFYLALSLAIRRLSYGYGHALLSFSPRIFVSIFIGADVVTTIIQITGAALIGVSESSSVRGRSPPKVTTKQANDILLAGLSVQSASFLAFLIILSVVTFRANQTRPATLPRKLTFLLIFTSLLVFLRTVFRLAETAQGVFGFASSNEILFALLEFLPVAVAVALWGAMSLDSILPPKAADHEVEKWEGRTLSMTGSNVGGL
ncbi:RTA1 like protein-domain-containing protein [Leucosporidium creatinivorum]|uniref:RTA1 like protein-domain-containing protein n=1 Tax=Leucosporidium creatinivorum TaxID=106004 RepID=A0A1Y2G451_9BASI|nr:RTA1 like protein-domain-containing protein [Leucosporidium creatinivorum]